MFGRRTYYVVEERRNDGCLTGIILLVFIIAAVVIFAWYALLVLAALLMIAGAIIGLFMTIKNNVKAYSDSIRTNKYYVRPNSSKITSTIFKIFYIAKDHISLSWQANTKSIKEQYAKSEPYRFLSFRKWMYLFACLSIAVWGVMVSLFVFYVYVQILMLLGFVALLAVLVACAIPLVAGAFLSVVRFVKNYTYVAKSIFTGYRRLPGKPVYLLEKGYPHIKSIFKNVYRKNIYDGKQLFSEAKNYSWLSLKRWMKYIVGVLLVPLGVILLIPITIIHALVVSLGIVGFFLLLFFAFSFDCVMSVFSRKVVCTNNRSNNKFHRNVYVCTCGEEYHHLRPGIRGIHHKLCRCGKLNPCTVISGRNKMNDKCPKCGARVNII